MVQLTFLPKMSVIYRWKSLFALFLAITVVLSENARKFGKYVSLIIILSVLRENRNAILVQVTIDHSVSD